MTYIASWKNRRIDISTHIFWPEHANELRRIQSGKSNGRNHVGYELDRMGLARVARTADYGMAVVTERGEAMIEYLNNNNNDIWY